MAYIANRPCRFGGNQFFIGDIVPDELIGNPETQVKRGIISMAASVAAKSTAAVPEADKATAETSKARSGKRARRAGDADGSNV